MTVPQRPVDAPGSLDSKTIGPEQQALNGLAHYRPQEQVSGTIRDVPLRWADVRREAKTLSEQGRKL